jgi:hypothetical protein
MLLVYRYRIKSLSGLLHSQARACNFVWNFCNDTQLHALKWNKRWPSGFDLNRLRTGLGTRKSMNRSLPESVRLANARRGRKVSQTSE